MPSLFHRASRRDGGSKKDFISGSFASSGRLIAQASNILRGHDRKSICIMQFHPEWQHKSCTVFDWYRRQQVSPGSTTFRTIEHRRDNDPPFFHEFLLLKQDDGNLYRIERTGEGSRLDAVRNIGCMANDYIRYFSASDYKDHTKNQTSELIAEIRFPCTFDVKDVLAICYSIFQSPRTRAYTLQRFNCYFFCSAIVLVLTRRLIGWEAQVTIERWKDALQTSLGYLRRRSRESSDVLLFRICRHIEPGNPEPTEFLIDALQSGLNKTNSAYDSVCEALRGNLWRNTWAVSMNRAIEDHVKASVATALEGDSECAKAFKIASTYKKKDMEENFKTYARVNSLYNKKAVAAISDGMRFFNQAMTEQYRMEQIEHPNSFVKEIWVSALTHMIGVFFPIQLAMSPDVEEWGFKGKS